MNAAELRAKVQSISPWFYEMDLGHGTELPAWDSDVLKKRADVYFDMGVKGM